MSDRVKASSTLLFISGLNPWITLQYRWYLEDFSGRYLRQATSFVLATSFTALCGLRVVRRWPSVVLSMPLIDCSFAGSDQLE